MAGKVSDFNVEGVTGGPCRLGSRVHRVVALAVPRSALDPVAAVEQAFAVCPRVRATNPAFLVPFSRGFVPLTHCVFVGTLQCCLRAIGVDPELYSVRSGHSFKGGGGTFAHHLGVDPF